ncbi:magnesium and cobalt transport protein CorA [Enemella dayhoffiae]|uniref:Magnesium transport protein CorA n=1 Tax=Enemella dayhoffiae TaxID=2016507 RepID=A0A255H1M1_9ACTN|nr:magnesium/cobalt transporter CorA [Enemella dayhoffiae]OYO21522.1 magnesium and cobalt transport protein CorA [Enemella dayhoffiae]
MAEHGTGRSGGGTPPRTRLALPPMRPRAGRPARAPQVQAPIADPPDSVVAWAHYVDGIRNDCTELAVATESALRGEGFVWLGLKDPSDEDMAGFAQQFNLHPLAIEDAVEGHTRSKLEQFGDTLFAVISTVAYVDHTELTDSSEIVSTGQVMVFVGNNFVMTVRRGEHAQLRSLRAKLESNPERLQLGPAEVLYAVMDKIIDDYMELVTQFETDIDEIERLVFSRQGTHEINRVYNLKRELIEFKRCVVPLGAPLQALASRPLVAIPDEARAYFRELSDHHLEAREAVQSFDEVLSTILSAALARASVEDNQDMRKISAFVAIAAIPTMIAGIYGMNFDNMPELHWKFGYFLIWGIMIVVMAGLYLGFRRNKWL